MPNMGRLYRDLSRVTTKVIVNYHPENINRSLREITAIARFKST